MTASELAALAAQCIAAGQSRVTLTLPKGWVSPKGFPRGELLSVNRAGERNVSFVALRLMAWMEREIRQHQRSA